VLLRSSRQAVSYYVSLNPKMESFLTLPCAQTQRGMKSCSPAREARETLNKSHDGLYAIYSALP